MHSWFSLVHVSIGVPFKLSDDDVFLAWTGIVIPSGAAVASVFVASVSVFIAWKARKIAEDSEIARVKADAIESGMSKSSDWILRCVICLSGSRTT